MEVRSKATGAATLKLLRHRRGLSLAHMARSLLAQVPRTGLPRTAFPDVSGVQRSIARWESGKTAVLPSERYQLLLAHLYARTPSGDLTIGPGSDFAELLDALAHLGEGSAQLGQLRNAVVRAATDDGTGVLALLSPTMGAALASALADPARTDEELAHGLTEVVNNVNAQVGSLSFVRLRLLLAPTVEACRRLLSGPVPDHAAPTLRLAALSAYTLAGRLAFETRDDTASRALYAEATRTAGLWNQGWRRATVHMSHALVTLYSAPDREQARRLVDAAVRDARSGESRLTRARAHALQAEIEGRAGHRRQAESAMRLAWYDMEHARPDDDPSPGAFSAEHLRGFEGLCELHVGDAEAAHDYFARSASALSHPRDSVQRAIVTADHALARVRLGDPQGAAGLLHECIGAAGATGARVPAIRLRQVRRELRPWRQEAFFADLDDHLMDSLGL
ncbi:hypothetical protein ACIHFE_33530 [Streptomyces sp. NPDC052396]|uniref:hypothetical protein n=1 Tax=Streptomyces sp. NPDC052396 TaxID=3365689 RepID=UPI0037D40126